MAVAVPDLHGLMYRKDPFNDWGIVELALVAAFLLATPGAEEVQVAEGRVPGIPDRRDYLLTESVIHLMDAAIEVKLLTVSVTVAATLQAAPHRTGRLVPD